MNAQRIIGLFCLLVVVICSDGCNRVRPDVPVAEAFEPAIEEPVSFMAGQITFNIRDLEGKVNKSLSTTLVPEETFEGSRRWLAH